MKKIKQTKLSDFKNRYVRCVDVDELRDFLWDYLIEVQGVEMTNMPSLSLVAYRILADGRWDRKK